MARRIILGLVALAALPAVALATDQTINLTANVQRFCKFDANPTFSSLNNISVASSSTSASVLNVTAATNSTGVMNTAGFTFAIQATCNYPSQVLLTSSNGGLKDGTPTTITGGTFLSHINYSAFSSWDGAPLGIFTTSGIAGATSAPQLAPLAHAGVLSVSVGLISNTSAPLAAGDYTDTLKVSLTPQ